MEYFYICSFCSNRDKKKKTDCCKKYWSKTPIIPIGSLVKMNEKGVKWHNSNENLDMFVVGGVYQDKYIENFHFESFIECYLGFENGENIGYVADINSNGEPRVYFTTPTGQMKYSYQEASNLKIVEPADYIKELLGLKMAIKCLNNIIY